MYYSVQLCSQAAADQKKTVLPGWKACMSGTRMGEYIQNGGDYNEAHHDSEYT